MIDNLNVAAHAKSLGLTAKGGIISMQERVLKVLEFEKVKEQLLEHVASSLGREMAEKLVPSTNFEEVVQRQEETDEAAKVLRMKANIPLGGIFNIRPHIKRCRNWRNA